MEVVVVVVVVIVEVVVVLNLSLQKNMTKTMKLITERTQAPRMYTPKYYEP